MIEYLSAGISAWVQVYVQVRVTPLPAVADRFEALPLRAMHPAYCERVRDRVERPRKTVFPRPIS